MKNLTKTILESNDKLKASKAVKIPALIASVFSVVFSLSIVLELQNIVNGIVFGFLAVFTVLFLIFNESIKLREIKNVFRGKKVALIPFFFTFIISVSLSGIGIYLWTNKSFEAKNKTELNKVNQKSEIEAEFLNKISDLQSQTFEDTKQYESLVNDLTYWKKKSAASLDERNQIREHIRTIESKIEANRNIFNVNINKQINDIQSLKDSKIKEIETIYLTSVNEIVYNDYVSYIFLIMILITEIAIIILNIDVAKFENEIDSFVTSKQSKMYLITRKVLQSLFLASRNMEVSIMTAQTSPVLNKLDWDDTKKWEEVKKLYNLFISLGILDKGYVKDTQGKKILYNKIVMNESEAFNKFDAYYNELLRL